MNPELNNQVEAEATESTKIENEQDKVNSLVESILQRPDLTSEQRQNAENLKNEQTKELNDLEARHEAEKNELLEQQKNELLAFRESLKNSNG